MRDDPLSGMWGGALMSVSVEQLVQVGVSHAEAPLDLLERLTVRADAVPGLLAEISALGATEAVVLSTCSRSEIYARSRVDPARLIEVLARQAGVSPATVHAVAQQRVGAAAVEHLLRVTAGLESRLVGEVDIQRQVRTAFRAARAAGTVGPLLDRVFPLALRCGDDVRSRTSLGRQGRSLARRAVDIGVAAVHGASPWPGLPEVLIVGSGQMASSATERLNELGLPFRVAARDESYAARLAGPDNVCALDSLVGGIQRADLLICATSASRPVVTYAHVREAMQARTRRLTVVDLAVPRNVDPAAGMLDRVGLVDLSGLNDDASSDPVVCEAVRQAEELVLAATRGYLEDESARRAGPLIRAVRTQLKASGRQDLLHRVTVAARAAAAADDAAALRSLCEAFEVRAVDVGL